MVDGQRDMTANQPAEAPIVPEQTENAPDVNESANVVRPTLGQLALGGALLLSDTVGTRLEINPPPDNAPNRTLENVLRPVAEWEPAETSFDQARYIAIGLTKDARRQADRGGKGLYDATDAIGQAVDKATRPVRRSRLMRPIRARFLRYQAEGEATVNRWAESGRSEENRSRAIAEASLGTFVQRSVTDLTESPHVQVLVQQVVASQGTSLIEEVIEEIRERVVTLDILVARRTRRKSPDDSRRLIPSPDFRHKYLKSRATFIHIPQIEKTLAGEFAGSVSRFLGFIIDVVLLALALSLITTFINTFINLFNLKTVLANIAASNDIVAATLAISAGIAGTIFIAAYGALSWSLSGQTIGDMLFGVRVVRTDGNRVSFARAVVRIIGAYLSGFTLFLGFLWAIWDDQHQGWHDKLAGTVVVYDWPAVPDEIFLREELDVNGVLPRQQRQSEL